MKKEKTETDEATTRYENVSFHFLGGANREDVRLQGEVLFRRGDMVLDIRGGDGPYLLVGKPILTWFAGERLASPRVNARWADVGNLYVGTWIEAGEHYLFSFRMVGK